MMMTAVVKMINDIDNDDDENAVNENGYDLQLR